MRESGVAVIEQPDRQAFADVLGNQVREMFLKAHPQEAALLQAIEQTQ
ncbi:Extracytoplasmic solute receptor protein yiaO [Edwardsiella tarda]|nr:Extracytoplasmic solute receptor protein yiaO [Edwardsiella tarda]